ncbi:SNF2-related protein [Pseudonocardia sp. WMMC193]|uniref:SNF2-related protein n=1 Tax=Pseudonocardia sp. WMMC193 TaxID=2911965 RepID=UPI001F0148BA|nr:SNF2-related protein [Pseudonocardia sp. WMMC193]MCF7547353.1 SNF2-related protein [Pseudonocardia sp. WMMC193]
MNGEAVNHKPEFATNDPENGATVASSLNGLLSGARTHYVDAPRIAIATAYFNPGGFLLLAPELEQAGGVRLLLGADPTDVVDGAPRRRLSDGRPRRRGPRPEVRRALDRHERSLEDDRNLLGFTREADSSARRLVAWLENHPDVEVRRYEEGFLHGKAFIVETAKHGVLAGSSNFTYAGLAKNNELNLARYDPTPVTNVMDWFDAQWDKARPYDLAALYKERWQAHQPWDIFLRMLHENYGDDLAEATRGSNLGLTGFQADGVWRAKRILDRRRGVLIADEVGLGKTFIAGELIYEASVERRQKVLVVCPATLRDSTWIPFLRAVNLRADVVSFEQLVADISDAGKQNSTLQRLDEYAMVVIDEAHGFRNNATLRAEALHRLVDAKHPKDLVLLTATPVNNSLEDLYTLIMYFARNDHAFADVNIPSLRAYFNDALATDPDDLTALQLFDVLDATTVRRTRRFVKNHYQGDKVHINDVEQTIRFPQCDVRRIDYHFTGVLPSIFDDLATALGANLQDDSVDGVVLAEPGEILSMARYVPSRFLLDGGTEQYQTQNAGLLRSALLKRFESSAHAFRLTVERMIRSHEAFLDGVANGYVLKGDELKDFQAAGVDGAEEFFDNLDDPDGDMLASAYDIGGLTNAVSADLEILQRLREEVVEVTAAKDPKIAALVDELAAIAAHATSDGIGAQDVRNKLKVLVFTYYADTANYLAQALAARITTDPRLAAYRERWANVSGTDERFRARLITGFAPETAGTGSEDDEYDLLITTDVLAEGVNLQQAANIVNYDLPWNPMKLTQRHGRIDRIGSPHQRVFMRCFFPDTDLDRFLGLEERLQRKLKQAAAAVGVGHVLPGIDPVERSITENRELIDQLRAEEASLFDEAGSAALSGEEYRRRLADAFSNPETKRRVLHLPWGSGTGLSRPGSDPGFVFCARVADWPKPIYRYISLNPDLTPRATLGEECSESEPYPDFVRDTLSALSAADPGDPATPPVDVPQEMFDAAFEAWSAARQDILRGWQFRTDPANLAPGLPKIMRDAATYVERYGDFLGEQQDSLTARLRGQYPVRILRAVREALRTSGEMSPMDVVRRLSDVADRFGLTIPEPPKPLPYAELEDIDLVCWVAINPPSQ